MDGGRGDQDWQTPPRWHVTGLVAGPAPITPASRSVPFWRHNHWLPGWYYLLLRLRSCEVWSQDQKQSRRFAVHSVGGIMGTLLAAFLGTEMFDGQGIKKETAIAQFMTQTLGLGVTLVWSVVTTIIIVFICKATVGLRVPNGDEETGLEWAEHGEPSYTL